MVSSLEPDSLPLPTPDSFSFPYAVPYDIQTLLMRHVYTAIEDRAAAVVESPTGTGKSLSLICSSLTWLQDDAARAKKAAIDTLRADLAEKNATEPKWMLEQEVKRRIDEYEANEREIQLRLEKIRADREKRQKEMKDRARYSRKRQRMDETGQRKEDDDDEEQFAPEEYEENSSDGLTPRLRALLDSYENKTPKLWRREDDEDEPEVRKIYFTSRTHSQLSQFQNELRKTSFAANTRMIALGSRQNLCINDKLKTSCKSVDALNDKCLDLQKANKGKRCEYLPPIDEPERLDTFRDHALSEPRSIEDLEELGRELHTCPYYGSRKAIKEAQLVTLPYNLLLLKQARESLGVNLEDNIVIVDEAHNLIDTILSIHSVEIPASQLAFAKSALLIYLKRFKARLKGSNATYLKQLVGFMTALDNFCKEWVEKKKENQMLKATELVQKCGADQINLRALDKYLTESKIAQKVSGYMENLEAKQDQTGRQSRSAKIASIHRIQTFLLALGNAEKDGRVLLTTTTNNGNLSLTLKYQLLNPSESFSDFAQARSVVIAGGTMAPLSDFAQQLLSFLPGQKIRNLSCSHVVPPENILVRAVGMGPTGTKLEFKYEQRGELKVLDEYGATLVNVANLVQKGVVVFVPSYAALDLFMQRWEKGGTLAKIKQKKAIFQEPKAGGESDNVLREYAASNANDTHGAILFAVVGAKLSEGINFQDQLCRCVVVIGIPYPSSQSTELKERMKYVSGLPAINGMLSGEAAGKRLYSNLAFRAVNQSIGRSIRHVNDWSAILLLDARYTQPATQAKLPAWISQNIASPASFGALVRDLASFMKARRVAPMQ